MKKATTPVTKKHDRSVRTKEKNADENLTIQYSVNLTVKNRDMVVVSAVILLN